MQKDACKIDFNFSTEHINRWLVSINLFLEIKDFRAEAKNDIFDRFEIFCKVYMSHMTDELKFHKVIGLWNSQWLIFAWWII